MSIDLMNVEYNLKIIIILLLIIILGCVIAVGFIFKTSTLSFKMYNQKFDCLNEKINGLIKIGKDKVKKK